MLEQLKARIEAENGIVKLDTFTENSLMRFLEGNKWVLETAF
jgi:hypothetical protein